jgi:cytochrome c-type biogenesis protein CcmH/NrfG
MSERLRAWLLFPVRTRARLAVAAAAVALLALAGWQGLRAYHFHRDRAAAKEALARYDFAKARRLLAACLRLRPGDPEALLVAAQAARRDGQLGETKVGEIALTVW